jgi:4a-hydroxytetrahydrobiopterin dehydratase
MGNYRVLDELEISGFIAKNKDWTLGGGKLEADFLCGNFKEAMEVVQAVGEEAEKMNHHPSWTNEYNKLAFSLCTHEANDQVTNLDIDLAKAITDIVNRNKT